MLASALAFPAAGLNGTERDHERQLIVCMAAPPDDAILEARRLVTHLFSAIDVSVKWKTASAGCPIDGVRAQFWLETPAVLNPGALGRAFPLEGTRIDVFYDRVRAAAPAPFVPSVLGHVLVHELAHIAQVTDQHAREGLMRARWDARELLAMHRQPLQFTATDAELIHAGLAARSIRLRARAAGGPDRQERD